MDENQFRDALSRHWAAADQNDFGVEHDIYREDAVLDYQQSGERISPSYSVSYVRGNEFVSDPRGLNR